MTTPTEVDAIAPPVGTEVAYRRKRGTVIGHDDNDKTVVRIEWADGLDGWHLLDGIEWGGKPKKEGPPTGSEVRIVDGHYVSIVQTEKYVTSKVITDFFFEPVRTLSVDGDDAQTIFEVTIDGKPHQVPSGLFSSRPQFKKWCNARRLEWAGTEKDLEGIFALLNRADVERLQGKTVIGLHGNSFVLPDEVIGESGIYAYVPPSTGSKEWQGAINLGTDPSWDLHTVELLAQLHRPDVMTPILGWIAAAPLRSTLSKFPPLGVTGGSGWGKTTLIETVLDAFGFWIKSKGGMSLIGMTPHAVVGMASSSNALPVWFDEYRAHSCREDTRMAVEQVLRDAWDGKGSPKGGSNRDNVMELHSAPILAPVIISGEESFSETSHLERLVIVNVPKDGRNRKALEALTAEDKDTGLPEVWSQGLGRAYIEWLLELQGDEDHRRWLTPPNLADRVEQSRAVVQWGYRLLQTFVLSFYDGVDIKLPAFDDTRIAADQTESLRSSPIEEAIEEGIDVYVDAKPLVWQEGDFTYCRVGALVSWIEKNRKDIKLPGGSKSMVTWLRENRGATPNDHTVWRRTHRWVTEA